MYKNKSVQEYIELLASREAVPGGGSAAALVCCLGIALTSMVCRYSNTSGKNSKLNLSLKKILRENENIRKKALALVDEDIAVFQKLRNAFSLPKDDKKRDGRIQIGLKEAARVPFEICGLCVSATRLCENLTGVGNKNLASDIGCSVYFTESAFQSAALNVKINLKYLKDKNFAARKKRALVIMSKNITKQKQRIIEKICF